jgi:hypothetical protein
VICKRMCLACPHLERFEDVSIYLLFFRVITNDSQRGVK